jgi:hypothetical protein
VLLNGEDVRLPMEENESTRQTDDDDNPFPNSIDLCVLQELKDDIDSDRMCDYANGNYLIERNRQRDMASCSSESYTNHSESDANNISSQRHCPIPPRKKCKPILHQTGIDSPLRWEIRARRNPDLTATTCQSTLCLMVRYLSSTTPTEYMSFRCLTFVDGACEIETLSWKTSEGVKNFR